MSKRLLSLKGQHVPPLPTLHFEMWVAARKDRAKMRRITQKIYGVARRITQNEGGAGPWVFLVDRDPPRPKTPRLRSMLGLKTQEDLWVELVFYPDKIRMKKIIKRIWKQPRFIKHASKIDNLLSKRRVGYQGTLAYARLQRI